MNRGGKPKLTLTGEVGAHTFQRSLVYHVLF
jgi:hypothetical protein